ncbi:MAG: hypothetical protein P8L83_07385 [Flavobacteriaceae bacterium]|nr:hypothetical protein [Flavobacteriaceae bacterium]
MKNLLFLLIILTSIFSYSQTVNGIPISELDAKYIRINSVAKILKPFQVKVFLDYGQISRFKDIKKGKVMDDDGKMYVFNGTMGVVNLLVDNGYRISHIYNSKDDSVNYVMEKIN